MRHSFCIDRLLWGSTVGHPSDSWASFLNVVYKLSLIANCNSNGSLETFGGSVQYKFIVELNWV